MDKKILLKAVNEDKARFIEEQWVCKDCWEQLYEYQDVKFYVNVYTDNRWIEDDPELITIVE